MQDDDRTRRSRPRRRNGNTAPEPLDVQALFSETMRQYPRTMKKLAE